MYQGQLFKKSYLYAIKLNPDKIFILSAKYGLLELNDIIEPYNITLNNTPNAIIKNWSEKAIQQLKNKNINLKE